MVITFAEEAPRSNLSKMVLAPWYFLVLMLSIYFTAALTSLMTISQLQPSVKDVDTLRRENAVVGCNWNSFVCSYLVNVLQFKPENIKQIRSIEDYPLAFERGEIKAAFFVSLHAKVFLTKHCRGYTLAGPTYNFGGFGFVSIFNEFILISNFHSLLNLDFTNSLFLSGISEGVCTVCRHVRGYSESNRKGRHRAFGA